MDQTDRDRAIIGAAAKAGAQAVVVCTNLHNFKALNVLVGHDEGDRILSRVNDYLCTLSDSSWRTGGDEFVVVLRDELLSARATVQAFSWLFHIRVQATEAWRFKFNDSRSDATVPYAVVDAAMTPRCGLSLVGADAEAALRLARERCADHAQAAFAAGWQILDDGEWAGFAPLSRGFSNRRELATPACPRCEKTDIQVLDQHLGWQRERCAACDLAYERADVFLVRGELCDGGYM